MNFEVRGKWTLTFVLQPVVKFLVNIFANSFKNKILRGILIYKLTNKHKYVFTPKPTGPILYSGVYDHIE